MNEEGRHNNPPFGGREPCGQATMTGNPAAFFMFVARWSLLVGYI